MADPKYLTGEVLEPSVNHYERELARIKAINDRISDELQHCREDVRRLAAERDAVMKAVIGLRNLLAPIWGEFSQIQFMRNVNSVDYEPAQSNAHSEIWDEWKRKLGKACGNIIEALQKHGALDSNQIAIITQCGRNNVSTYMSRLNKANLISKNGNKYSLKEL